MIEDDSVLGMRIRIMRLAGIYTLLLCSRCLWAEDTEAEQARSNRLDPIVVTARGRGIPVSKTPGGIGVVGNVAISQSAAVSIPDLLDLVAGVSRSADGAWGADVNIRGLSRNSVILLIDGCRVNTATDIGARFGFVEPMGVKQIEILKGPISSLYGSGSIGGVVNVITRNGRFSKQPEWDGGILGSLWSNPEGFNTFGYTSFNSPRFYAYASQSFRDHGSYTDGNGDEVRNSQFEDRQTKLALGCRLSETCRSEVNIQYFLGKDIGIPGSGTAPLPSAADVTYPETERGLISLVTTCDPRGGVLKESGVNLYYQYIDRRVRIDNFPALHPMHAVCPWADHDTCGIKWQNTLEIAGGHSVLAGLDAWQRQMTSYRVKYFKNGTIMEDKPLPDSSFTSVGVFVEDDWIQADTWIFNAGGRMDAIHVKNEATANWVASDEDENGWNLHLGLTWKPIYELSMTVIGAGGYRAASLEERYQYLELGDGWAKYGNPDLDPERSLFAEYGVNWQGDTLALGVSAFCNQLQDLIGEESQGTDTIVNRNINEAYIHGYEIESMWLPVIGIEVYGNLAYVEGRDTRTREPLPAITPLSGLVGTAYGRGGKGMWTCIEMAYAAKQNRIPHGFDETPGWVTVDVRWGYSFTKGEATHAFYVGVDNLFNETYRNHLTTYRGPKFNEPGRSFIAACDISF